MHARTVRRPAGTRGQPESENLSMSTAPRATMLHAEEEAEVRRRILAAADELLAGDDVAPFSIRRLVARCGAAAPTIYRHFGDKRQLLGVLLEARLAALAGELEAVPEAVDPAERLRAMARVFAEFALASPTYYRLFVFADEADVEPPPSAARCSGLLAEPLDRLAERGRIDPPALPLLKRAFWALVHGVVSLQVMRPETEEDAHLLDVALDGLIAGTISPTDAACMEADA